MKGFAESSFLSEAKELVVLGWAQILSSTLEYLVQVIPVIFCGRLGTRQLAAVSLACSLINLIGSTSARACGLAADTFIAQTFGSANKYKVGEHCQRALIISFLIQLVAIAILINAKPFLLLIGQIPEIVDVCQSFLYLRLWGLPFFAWYFILSRYAQNQAVVIPNLVISVIGCGMSIGFHFLFVVYLEQDIQGSALALNLTYMLMCVLLVAFIWGSGVHKDTWSGWSTDCLQEWYGFFSLAGASGLLISLSWWSFEYGTFIAGNIGEVQLGAQSILFQVEGIIYMFNFGLASACQTRVGTFLGSLNPDGAVGTAKTGCILQAFIAIITTIFVWVFKMDIFKIFTTDNSVVETGMSVMPYFIIFLCGEQCLVIVTGIVRGLGRQMSVALLTVVGLVIVAIPISVCLTYMTTLGLIGMWIGYDCGYIIQGVVYVFFLTTINWVEESKKKKVPTATLR